MKKTLQAKLQSYGYTGENTDELIAALPKEIWISSTEKNLRRMPVIFSLVIKGDLITFSLSVQYDKTGEVDIIHQETDKMPLPAIARMIIFIESHKLTDTTI